MNERNARTQEMLKAEGLYKGKIDGVIGPLTRKALELHNKQQYQPLPRQRPGPETLRPEAVPTMPGGPGAEATGRLSMVPQVEAMPPMPDSSAFINDPNPTYGGPNPETSEGIRSGINSLLGHDVLINPLRPNYAPQFTEQPGPPPAQPDLGQMLQPLAGALSRLLARQQ